MNGPDLDQYDRILVAFSGGKDSIASVCHLLEAGVEPERIELHHHDVDGQARSFMDWPSTPFYCRAVAAALSLPLYLSWREGGFEREMLRLDQPTAPIRFECPDGSIGSVGGDGPLGTRQRFPQVSADLRVRWCSPYCKIDVMAALIRGQPRFWHGRTLVVTGERAEEGANRARYAPFEPHRTDARDGRRGRHVDHWRPVHRWSAERVWSTLQQHGIVPAPAYRLGWSRSSCAACIFSSPDQWATLRFIAPARFERIAVYEQRFGWTLRPGCTIRDLADRGRPYPATIAQPALVRQALSPSWDEPVTVSPWHWQMPAGAGGEAVGPN
jgi:3'-phosphoadenosine 5'-phosphosulfate sulfotransferase (PAPS reductase)/FAD synthetase